MRNTSFESLKCLKQRDLEDMVFRMIYDYIDNGNVFDLKKVVSKIYILQILSCKFENIEDHISLPPIMIFGVNDFWLKTV